MSWEAVIGLEVHTHLATDSKLFSPAPVRYGDEPNHDVHFVDLGLPGVLPVLNERVVELAIRLGLAIHGTVNPHSVFARKNYFYPDLPKGYQISQYELPVVSDGHLDIEVPVDPRKPRGELRQRRIGITRAHLEEDAGKSVHDSAIAGRDGTAIDLNRCGVPLLEIVSEPDLRTSGEAGAYLRKLRALLRWVGVSEGDLEKGQFRCDANVSVRPEGQEAFGTRTELKNINSFRFVEAAIDAEIARQIEVIEDGGEVVQATMGFDPERHRTRVLRIKENADDYRYFPDPDLIPLVIAAEHIESVRAALPELPDAKQARFQREYELSAYDAGILTESAPLADFFEEASRICGKPKAVANWIARDVLAILKEREVEIDELSLSAQGLGSLITLVEEGRVTARSARELLPDLAREGGDPEDLIRARGLEAVSDSGELEAHVDRVIAANPQALEQIAAGDKKAVNFLMGQVMKKTQGKADAGQVRRLLDAKLGG